MYTAASRPPVHKQFVIVPKSFKLTSANQIPEVSQSTTLFKLSDAKLDTLISQNETQEVSTEIAKEEQTSQDVTIIPSSFVTSSGSQFSTGSNSHIEDERRKLELSNKLNTEAMQRYHEQNQTKPNKKNDIITTTTNYRNNTANNQSEVLSSNQTSHNADNDPISSILDMLNQDVGRCPICEGIKQGREENIAWNIWRSRLQNAVMDASDVANTPAGTVYNFSFDVDNNGNISNIKVSSNYPKANSKVESAIKSFSGKSILKFPEGSKRKTVHFKGSFMMSYITRHSTPSDFNDFEKIFK